MNANTPAAPEPEIPPVAVSEARAAAPSLVASIEAVARTRLLTVRAETLLAEVALLLSNAQISLVVVCSADGTAVGVITETILVRQLGFGKADIFTTQAGDVMTSDFTTCLPSESLSSVLAMMHSRGLIHVVVVDAGNKPVGIANARDGLRALLAAGNQEEELLRNYVMGIGYQ